MLFSIDRSTPAGVRSLCALRPGRWSRPIGRTTEATPGNLSGEVMGMSKTKHLEELARAVRELARLAEDDLEDAPEIVARVLGENSIAIVPALRNQGYLQH